MTDLNKYQGNRKEIIEWNEKMGYRCLICGKWFDYEKLIEVNFLWNDEFYYGKPLCKDCANLWKGNKHLNYEIKKVHKPIGLEKWL